MPNLRLNPLIKKLTLATTAHTLALHISACTAIFNTSSGSAKREQREQTTPVIEQSAWGVEVIWEIPSEPVDGFVIRYGQDRANLSKETTILRSELREESDPQYGSVYRYPIRDIPQDQNIFVSVAAFKGDVISEFSDAVTARSKR
ncbi:MAG: hypothetical protein ACK5Y6_07885 [Pseudomonadota bacterium]